MSTRPPMPPIQDWEVRIDRGAKYFDSLRKSWAKNIPVRQIDLSDPKTSPAAWVIGADWDEKITTKEAHELGLDFSLIEDKATISLINRMWKAQVTVRRAKKSSRTTQMVAESA